MVEILFCLMSTLVNCLISTYLLHIRTWVHKKKMLRYTLSACFKIVIKEPHGEPHFPKLGHFTLIFFLVISTVRL